MPFVTITMDGGLDLVTPPISVAAGRIQACENIEVALNQGYRTPDGYERFDGGQSPSGTERLWALFATGVTDPTGWSRLDTNFYATGTIVFAYTYNGKVGELIANVIKTETTGGTTGTIFFTTSNSADATIIQNCIYSTYGYEFVTPYEVTAVLFIGDMGFFDVYNFANVDIATIPDVATELQLAKTYYDAARLTVQEVPGQGNVLGLFWLKDYLYAVRDYVTLGYEYEVIQSNPGDELYIGASYATATWKGFLAKDSVDSADTTTGEGAGVYMFYDTTGTPTAGLIYNHTQGDVQVAAVTVIGAEPQGAGLYKAVGDRTTRSWEHQDIGYTVDYKGQLVPFQPANRISPTTDFADLITSTDWVIAGGQVSGGGWSAVGGTPGQIWTVVNGTDLADTVYAGYGMGQNSTSPFFWINQFGLTDVDVPDGSVVTGFTVEITHRSYRNNTLNPGMTGNIQDASIVLTFPDGGSSGASFANTTSSWQQSAVNPDFANYEIVTYGGPQSLLGNSGVTPDAVKDSEFGLRMAVKLTGKSNPTANGGVNLANQITPHINLIKLKVHFVPPQPQIYFWNGTSAVIADVVTSYNTGGTIADPGGTATGHLYLMNVGTNRAVEADEEIRTMPAPGITPDGGAADGSSLIATTAISMTKNVMDWSSLLNGAGKNPNKSKYQYDVSNFYAAADFDAIYGVSGAGPAFMYDGIAFTRIWTGTPESEDIPRHVRVHQSRLFLGYRSGSVQWSEPGDPLTFDALTGTSGEIGVGAAVRGLMQLNGDALAIIHQKGVAMIQGDVGLEPYPGTISPDVGCVEYSAQSMGQFMYTSFRGVQNLRSTQSYGDFDTSQFSWNVWSFLRPRVQTSAFFESDPIGVINSLAVRNKSQYRLQFADGYQLTATFLREGEMPQYTIQRYFKADGVTPHTWDVVCAGVESNGRDRLFGASNDNTGYVYEIDRGKSFDGGNITGYLTLAVDDQKVPFQDKLYTDCHVHGIATGYFDFQMSRAVNYDIPEDQTDPGQIIPHNFGSLTDAPLGMEKYYFSKSIVKISGRCIAIRFDFSHNNLYPMVLQAISYNIVPEGTPQS